MTTTSNTLMATIIVDTTASSQPTTKAVSPSVMTTSNTSMATIIADTTASSQPNCSNNELCVHTSPATVHVTSTSRVSGVDKVAATVVALFISTILASGLLVALFMIYKRYRAII